MEGIAGENAAGIKEVFKEEWPGGLAQYGACSDISPIAVDGIVDNVCDAWNPGHNCGCAVVDQLKAKQLEDRAGPVNCEDFSEGEFGFNNHRTSQGGASWTAPQFGSCNSYPLMRNGHYPWMVYYSSATDNDGNGVKFGSGNRIWSPIPLDPASNQSGIANNAGRGLSSSNHAVLDITGDGIIDVLTLSTLVTATTVNGTDGRHWNVFPGKINDLTGEFDGFSQKPYIWLIPESARMSSSQGTLYGTEADGFTSITRSMTRLIDTNADGLPDLVRLKPDNTGFEVALNTGRSFCVNRLGEVPGTILKGEKSFDRTAYNNVLARPGAITTNPGGSTTQGPYTPISGEGKNLANLVDLDGDGLPDYYDAGDDIDLKPFKCAESAPSFFLFNGATGCSDTDYTQVTMGAGAGFRSEADGVHHYIPRDIQVGGKNDSTVWWQKSDYMDLDGDGVDDLATPNETSQYHWDLVSEDTEPGKPLRLLNAINNGHGLITEIEYHPYNDARATSNASTGKGMPTHIWVVTKIHSSSAIAEEYSPVPDGEVNIKYGDPAYTKNHRNQHGFRGFESIQTSRVHDVGATSGFSVSEQRYDYEIDWSGRMAESLTYVDGFPIGAGEPVAGISTKEWAERSLFSEATKSFHMVSGSSRNCLRDDGSFHDESGCVGYHQFAGSQVTEMRAIADSSGGDDVAWVPVATISSRRSDIDEGSKRSESDVEIFSEPTKYMLHSTEKRNYVREAGQWVLAGRTTSRLDTTNTYVQYSGQVGTVGGSEVLLESKTTRDQLGLVTESQDPEDFGTSFKTTTSYSGLKVHATSVTNERGHTATVDTDYGTGQVTRALGANVLPCDTSKFEGVETYYDKLGRPTGASRRSCAGNSYHLEDVSSVEYVDYELGTPQDPVMIPAHMIATTILDIDTGSASVATSFVDGAGRTLRTELGLGSDSAITISHYNSAGQIVRHQESNPSTGPGNTDEFTETVYSYDSLGRATEMRQGNNSSIGVNLSYSFRTGISKTTTVEIVSDDGPAAEKTVYSDHFGRMLQVDEKMDGGGYASTMYEFDGNDNIAKITSASNEAGVDGVVTDMVHDKAGRRTKVIRGEREWSYAYDKNGSMVRETSPNDSGESANDPAAGLYTTSTVYDVIGRPTSRLLAVNGLSKKEQKLYDVYSVGYQYDFCTNGKGKLCSQQSGSTLETDYIYDWAGRVVEERQKIGVSETVFEFGDAGSQPDFTMERSSHFAYNSSGAVVEAWMPDGTDQASSTHLQYEYNEFTGAPEKLSQFMGIDKGGNPTMQEIAFVTRNRAQRVVSQTTGCLTRQWDYDHLGRVTNTEVQGVGCTAQNGPILSESMQYFDSSEVKQHDVYRAGLTQRSFDYNYDSQHQLIDATDNNSYSVAFDYSPSGNGTLKSVQGIDGVLLGRDPMVYSYGDGTLLGADEHAPTSLLGFAKDLHYSYDFAGNVAQRTEISDPTGSPSQDDWSFTYDGISQQREVRLNNGTGGRELYFYDNGGQRYMAITFENGTDALPERIRVWMGGAEIWYRQNATASGMEVDTEYAYLSLGAINIGRIKSEGPVVSTEATFANGLSHVMGSVDWDSGVVNAAYIYGPYGEIVDSVGAEQDDHLRRFNGKEADQLSKLSYYGFRYYDEQSLSWTQADPLYLFAPDIGLGNPREMSLYTFTMNNPIRYMDPDGRAVANPGCTHCGGDGGQYGRNGQDGQDAGVPADAESGDCPGGSGVGDQGCSDIPVGSASPTQVSVSMWNPLDLVAAAYVSVGCFLGCSDAGGGGVRIDKDGKVIGQTVGAKRVSYWTQAEDVALAVLGGKILKSVGGWLFSGPKCFAGETLVETNDGLVPIKEIKIGDMVWSRDDETGEEDWKSVVKLFVTPNKELLELDLLEPDGDEQKLFVTAEHPLWTEDGWTAVSELRLGNRVWSSDDWVEVLSVAASNRTETVYNFEVEDFHSYFVGEGGIWAHNQCVNTISSSIRGSEGLIKEASKMQGRMQQSIDSLQKQLANGNMKPGIGTKSLFNGIFEARARDGARLYFRNLSDGFVDIVGVSSKANQKRVISLLRDIYGD